MEGNSSFYNAESGTIDFMNDNIQRNEQLNVSEIDYDEEVDFLKREQQIQEGLAECFDDIEDDCDGDHSSIADDVSRASISNEKYTEEIGGGDNTQSKNVYSGNIGGDIDDFGLHIPSSEDLYASTHCEETSQNTKSDFLRSDVFRREFHRNLTPSPTKSDAYVFDNQQNHSLDKYNADQSKLEKYENLQDEYRTLQILYNTRGKELDEIKQEEIRTKETSESEIKSLKIKLQLSEGKKDELTFSLNQAQHLISELKRSEQTLQMNVNNLELKLEEERQSKERAQRELESKDFTTQALEQQINDLTRSDSLNRLRQQNENIIKDLKKRHQDERLRLKEEIDNVQKKLRLKVQEVEDLQCNFAQSEKKYEQMQIAKSETINKLSENLEASQKQCQQLLESGNSAQVNVLRFQFQHLEEEKEKVVEENKALKKKLNELEVSHPDSLVSVEQYKNLETNYQKLQKELQSNANKLKVMLQREEKMQERNEHLLRKIARIEEGHTDKMNTINESQENTMKKLKEDLKEQYDKELKNICIEYENKMQMLEDEIKHLNDKLYDAKSDYIKMSERNTELQLKLQEATRPKEREEIEKEIREEYEKKKNEYKEYLAKSSTEMLKTQLEAEIEKAQETWAQEKMEIVKEFIEDTKQKYDVEFQKCLEKEHSMMKAEYEVDKEKLCSEYETKLFLLEQTHEEDKEKSRHALSEDLQNKWKEKLLDLRKSYEIELQNKEQQFERKMSIIHKEMKNLQQTDGKEETRKLEEEYNSQRALWKKQKEELTVAKSTLEQKLMLSDDTAKKLCDKVEKYQSNLFAAKEKHREEIKQRDLQIEALAKSEKEMENKLHVQKTKYKCQIEDQKKKFLVPRITGQCQTEEQLVPKKKLIDLRNTYEECLKKVLVDVENYLSHSTNRHEEDIRRSLFKYHNFLISKVLEGMSNNVPMRSMRCFSEPTMNDFPKNGTENMSSPRFKNPCPARQFVDSSDKNLQSVHRNRADLKSGMFNSLNRNFYSDLNVTPFLNDPDTPSFSNLMPNFNS